MTELLWWVGACVALGLIGAWLLPDCDFFARVGASGGLNDGE